MPPVPYCYTSTWHYTHELSWTNTIMTHAKTACHTLTETVQTAVLILMTRANKQLTANKNMAGLTERISTMDRHIGSRVFLRLRVPAGTTRLSLLV